MAKEPVERRDASSRLHAPGAKARCRLIAKLTATLESEETQRPIKHPDFDPTYHFAMHWHPEATTPTDGKSSSIPLDPHGMSGSFIWNTRVVEFADRDETWTPGVARLTGIVWGWDTSIRFLFATRIEHVTALLDRLYP